MRNTSCRCVFHLLNRAGFVFTTGENLLSQRARLVCWAQSPSCHSTVSHCSLLSSCGSALISKSPAVECRDGWLAWCNHGPYHWDLSLFPAQGEGQIAFIPIGMVSFWAFAVPPTMPPYVIFGYSLHGVVCVWHFRNTDCYVPVQRENEEWKPKLMILFDLLAP